jgi:hypothetical protein
MKFNDDIKKENSSGNYFNYGVHKVHLGAIENGETEAGKEYIELTLLGDNEEEDTARVWFTTDKAANYSFNVLKQIAVHNAPEKSKDAARDAVDACQDTDELVKLFNEKVVGGECWLSVYPSPDRTYTASDGSVKKSIDKNVAGYQLKERPELLPKQDVVAEVNDDTDVAAGIPDAWK